MPQCRQRYSGSFGGQRHGRGRDRLDVGLHRPPLRAKYFVPWRRDVDWTNGNIHVFVLPMAVGLAADAMFQLPILQCNEETCWNESVVTQLDLLCVLLSGLVIAFTFTLAFRGVLGVRSCYWGVALAVHSIVAYLVVKALPFV